MFYLISGAGAPNFGDEFIVRAWLAYLREKSPNSSIFVDSTTTNISSMLNSEVNPKAQFVTTLRDIAKEQDGLTFWEQLQRGWEFEFSPKAGPGKLRALLESILSKCRIVHILGGGYINVRNPKLGFLLGVAANISRTFNIPLYATGVGLMPMNVAKEKPIQKLYRSFTSNDSSMTLLTQIIAQFSIFEVRDSRSFDFLESLPSVSTKTETRIAKGLDDCFLEAPKILDESRSNSERVLHLSCGKHALDYMRDYLIHLAPDIREQFDRQVFWECFPKGDFPGYKAFTKLFPNMELLKVEDLLRQGFPYSGADFMISTRFHPHLLFARTGGQGAYHANPNSVYYLTKHGSLITLGSPFRQLSNDLDFTLDSENLLSRRDRLLTKEKRELADNIYE
jgi:hypothetical protein